jgi:hypothetical protein
MQYELILDLDADKAWAALREVGLAHKLFAGALIDGHLDGDIRTVSSRAMWSMIRGNTGFLPAAGMGRVWVDFLKSNRAADR